MTHQPSASDERERGAERSPGPERADRARQASRRRNVGDQGERGRIEEYLSHPDQHPGGEELTRASRQGARHTCPGPDDHADENDAPAIATVRDGCCRNPENGREYRDRETLHQAVLGVRHLERRLDGLHDDVEDLKRGDRRGVTEGEHADRPGPPARSYLFLIRCVDLRGAPQETSEPVTG